jgi:hypothetical protein
MAYIGDDARKCKIFLSTGGIMNGKIVKIEVDEIFGPNAERNVQGELEIDKVHKISRYIIEVVE